MNRDCRTMLVALGLACAAMPVQGEQLRGPLPLPAGVFGVATVPTPPEVMIRQPDGRAIVRAVRIPEPLTMDGELGEEVYRTVKSISELIQTVPDEGAPATERTEAWVLFDDRHIYVAARCWDPHPASDWVANEFRRDTNQLRQNDTFGVSFDTFHDRRNGFVFYTNPFGARADYAVTDEVANFDWNPVWDVRTGRFQGGWTVEMRIPFKSLRYRSGSDQTWGMQLRRVMRHKNEWTYLSRVPASSSGPYGFTRVSFGGPLVGLDLPTARRNIELKPYGITQMTTDRRQGVVDPQKTTAAFGIDAKYALTANLTADVTYNTDFAQVEVDEQQVNLTRFTLLFPEKREFFLEGRGLFEFARGTGSSTGEDLAPLVFFTRRIGLEGNTPVPIDIGARVTGKVGKVGIGALNIQTGGSDALGLPGTNFTVLRLKRDVLRRSGIGAIFTHRSRAVAGDGANQAFGLDGTFSLGEDVNFSGFAARTRTPGLEGGDTSHEAKFTYTGDRYGLLVDRLVVGRNFNPEIGFVPRRDFERSFALARFSPRPRSIPQVRKFTWEGSLDYLVNGTDALESREQAIRFITEFQSSDQITLEATRSYELVVRPFEIADALTIPAGGYRFGQVSVSYLLGGQRRANGTLSLQRGSFYGGTITSVELSRGQITITPRLQLEPSFSTNRIALPDRQLTSHLVRSRANYSFSTRMFVSALLQYNSATRSLGSNLRFRWEYRPGSEIFLVYTDERGTLGRGYSALQNRALVLKINKLLMF